MASTALLVLLAIPVLSLRLGQLDAGSDPTSQSDRRAYDLISKGFGEGVNGPLTVVLTLPDGVVRADQQTLLSSAQKTLAGTPGVASAARPPPAVGHGGGHQRDPDDRARRREDQRPGRPPARHGAARARRKDTYLVGTTAGYVDFTEKIGQRMIWLILAVVLLSLMLLTSRSGRS